MSQKKSIKFRSDDSLEFTSVVLKTKYMTMVKSGRKFYIINNNNVTEGKEWVCPKASGDK